jgi:hypothetical protein
MRFGFWVGASRKRKWLIAVAAAITLIFVVREVSWFFDPLSRPGLPKCQSVGVAVRHLLLAEVADRPNWVKRNNYTASHITGLINDSVWQRAFPVRFARERVFLLGREAVNPLLAIVGDPAEDPIAVQTAWYILVEFDDRRIRGEIASQLHAGKLSQSDAAWLLSVYLPIDRSSHLLSSSPMSGDDRVEVFLEETNDLTYEVLCLRLLDEILKPEFDIEGITDHIERWLNLRYGQDIDEWLADKAPDALAFRNRELARGYDPVVSFRRLYRETGNVDEGIKAVFADQESKALCHRLLDAVYGYLGKSPMHIPHTEGWQKRVRGWYAQHRNELRYDPDKHRFVVGTPAEK